MTDSLIFDVDGTIWDTTPVVAKAWNAALDECGLSYARVDAARLKGLFGLPMDDIIADILPSEPSAVRGRFKTLCYRNEHEYLEKEPGILYPEIKEVFKKLSEVLPVFIISNCQSGYIELLLKKTGMSPYVTDFSCYGDKGLLKAENIRLMVQKHSLKHPYYVGDTQMDANACKEAGVPIIYASYGFGKVEHPDAVIQKPVDLLTFIQRN
jgi:phosphoglycolate phosphatase